MTEKLSEDKAKLIVDKYMSKEDTSSSNTQQILDSGAIPKLKGFIVKPGKVSDSIFGGNGSFYNKKTNENVDFENPPLEDKNGTPLRIMVRTEKISTHDISRGAIPFKDQILATNHNFMRRIVQPYIGTSQFDVPSLKDNAIVIVAENLRPINFENVIRAYMAKSSTTTSLYVNYMDGKREFCGHKLPNDLFTNGPLSYIMDTPSTKSDEHDESVSPEFLFKNNICTPAEYNQIRNASIAAFGAVSLYLSQKGIILVDTKTEHGKDKDGIIKSQDELYTMDSSRFWLSVDYYKQMADFLDGKIEEIKPASYSKEFAREFSVGNHEYDDNIRQKIAVRYIIGIQQLTGETFEPDMRGREERVVAGLQTVVNELIR